MPLGNGPWFMQTFRLCKGIILECANLNTVESCWEYF